MKKKSTPTRIGLPTLSLLFAALFIFSSCKKEPPTYDSRTESASVMAFNLSPDKSSIGYMLSGWPLGNYPLNFTSYTGMYLPVLLGEKEVKAVDFNTGTPIAGTTGKFVDSMHYSFFLLGAKGNYQTLVVEDDLTNLTAVPGKAWVRYINGITDDAASPYISIGEAEINETAAYGLMSAFKAVNAGDLAVSISYGGSIANSRTITLEENKIYTVFLAGSHVLAHSGQGLQIRFVKNGAVIIPKP